MRSLRRQRTFAIELYVVYHRLFDFEEIRVGTGRTDGRTCCNALCGPYGGSHDKPKSNLPVIHRVTLTFDLAFRSAIR